MPMVTTTYRIENLDRISTGWKATVEWQTHNKPTFWENINPFSKAQETISTKVVQYYSVGGGYWYGLPDMRKLGTARGRPGSPAWNERNLDRDLNDEVDKMKALNAYHKKLPHE